MGETQDEMLQEYEEYLRELIRTGSGEIFTNGGLRHASVLMSVLLSQTRSKACFFSEGFSPEVIQDPYLSELKKFLEKKDIEISILLETDKYIGDEPLAMILKERSSRLKGQGIIDVRLITEEDKKHICNELNCKQCNFSVFDQKMYRFEYEPKYYKAYGSFGNEENCRLLGKLFDEAFHNAKDITTRLRKAS